MFKFPGFLSIILFLNCIKTAYNSDCEAIAILDDILSKQDAILRFLKTTIKKRQTITYYLTKYTIMYRNELLTVSITAIMCVF